MNISPNKLTSPSGVSITQSVDWYLNIVWCVNTQLNAQTKCRPSVNRELVTVMLRNGFDMMELDYDNELYYAEYNLDLF